MFGNEKGKEQIAPRLERFKYPGNGEERTFYLLWKRSMVHVSWGLPQSE